MSYLEDTFAIWCNLEGLPPSVREYVFHPERKWRFDFAWVPERVAVEIEGGLFKGGRHQTLQGFMDDCEKYEAALLLGWRVYRVPGPWVAEGKRAIWRPEVMETLKELLRR